MSKYNYLFLSLAACILAIISSCTDETDAFDEEKTALSEYITKQNMTVDTIADGLYYIKGRTGIGNIAENGDSINVIYEGFPINKSSYTLGTGFHPDPPNNFYKFKLGNGDVISGWDIAFA